jgi:hypothetical protein
MSEIRNQNVNRKANVDWKTIPVALDNAINLTSAVVYSLTPGYKLQIEKIASYCRTKAGTVTAVVKVGGRTAASVTFTAATEVAQTLSTTLANIRASATEAITIELTTDGSGALVNGFISITFRPWPKAGELGPNT